MQNSSSLENLKGTDVQSKFGSAWLKTERAGDYKTTLHSDARDSLTC